MQEKTEVVDEMLALLQDADLVRMLLGAGVAIAAGGTVSPPTLAEDPFVLWIADGVRASGRDAATLEHLADQIRTGADDPDVHELIEGFRQLATDHLLERRSEAAS